jgi:hypothetical protein
VAGQTGRRAARAESSRPRDGLRRVPRLRLPLPRPARCRCVGARRPAVRTRRRRPR